MFSSGHACLCRRAAPAIFELASPFCYRCTGMLAGVALGATIGFFTNLNFWNGWLLAFLGIMLVLPALADVAAQRFSSYRSNALRRTVSGILLGLGIVCIGTMLRITLCGSPISFA